MWTTTPWTLVSNTAVAANPDVDYVVAGNGEETLVVAAPLLETALGEGWTVEATVRGRDMERWTYQRPFELVEFPAGSTPAHFVVLGDYVTTEDGTGLVHQSPAFGEDDMAVCKAYGLPVVNPVRPDGHFEDALPLVGGQFFKHADADLVKDLDKRGVLFRHLAYEHSYPHCWRCHTALLYYAQPSWYVRTTAVKDALLRENEKTNWFPDTIKWGRYGDWLNNNIDWALSRSRYWGTPLPIWRCAEGHQTCVGSLAELSGLTGTDQSELDPHRPYVDDVTFACPDCGEEARRVPEVIDAWFDCGSMPFAQWGYPHAEGSEEAFRTAYPADFICEAIDQTRGWFYTLMAIGTLVFDQSSYRNVLCLGHILAEDGRKMSKHLGNILEPIPLMEQHGADAVRWFMACSGSPWAARRVGHGTIQETVRKVLLTYWNTVAFHVLYARSAGWTPGGEVPPVADRPVLDRWLHAETARLTRGVTEALEAFDTQRAGSLLAQFVDDLSNWYVRRSRRRFWDGDPAALATLHETLATVTQLMAPLTPFITERVWQDVVRPVDPAAPESVHLADWPACDRRRRRRGALGRGRARAPPRRARPGRPRRRQGAHPPAAAPRAGGLRGLGPAHGGAARRGGRRAQRRRARAAVVGRRRPRGPHRQGQLPGAGQAVRQAHPAGRRRDRAPPTPPPSPPRSPSTAGATVSVDGEEVEVLPDEVIVSERPREGWSVVNEQGETVALDLELTPALVRAGSGPRGGPAGAGGPQEQRLRRHRPDRAHLEGHRGDRRGAARARPARRRGGAGGRDARGRARGAAGGPGRRHAHRVRRTRPGPRADLLGHPRVNPRRGVPAATCDRDAATAGWLPAGVGSAGWCPPDRADEAQRRRPAPRVGSRPSASVSAGAGQPCWLCDPLSSPRRDLSRFGAWSLELSEPPSPLPSSADSCCWK